MEQRPRFPRSMYGWANRASVRLCSIEPSSAAMEGLDVPGEPLYLGGASPGVRVHSGTPSPPELVLAAGFRSSGTSYASLAPESTGLTAYTHSPPDTFRAVIVLRPLASRNFRTSETRVRQAEAIPRSDASS